MRKFRAGARAGLVVVRLRRDFASHSELGGGEGMPRSEVQLRGGMRDVVDTLSPSTAEGVGGTLVTDAERRLLGSVGASIGVSAPAGALDPRAMSEETFRIT